MQIRQITPTYAVSPQIDPSDCDAIAQAGFVAIICNRPDHEIPPSHHADTLEMAAKAAGLKFDYLPITHQTLTLENVTRQAELVEEAGGPILAYCASGTRCSIIWALGQAGHMSPDEIISAGAAAGYDLSGLRGALGG